MVDRRGSTIGFYLSSTRNTRAVRRGFAVDIRGRNCYEKHPAINLDDKAFTHYTVIAEFKEQSLFSEAVMYRKNKKS